MASSSTVPAPPTSGKWILTTGTVEAINGVITIQGAQTWKFLGPTSASITSITPTSGPVTGGTPVTITGAGFSGTNAVKFGAIAAPFKFISDTVVTATSPKEAAGTVDITVITTNDGTTSVISADKFTYIGTVPPPPPPPPGPSGMAIGVSLGNAQALWTSSDHGAAQYAAMHADGFYGVRIDCPMNNPGVNDATIRAAIAAGLDVLLILDGYQTQNGPAAFAAFATSTVKEYAPLGVHHYEVLNEPGSATNWDTKDNFVNPTAYAALCKQAYAAIKAADSASTVILGGNSVFTSSNGAGPDANGNYVGSLLPATFLTAVYAANGGTTAGLCDAIGMHPYCDPNLPSASNNWGVFLNPVGTAGFYGDSVFTIMSAHGEAKKDVWITEFGFQTATIEATGYTNAINLAMASPCIIVAFYCFNWSDDTDGNYGLNTSAYVAKPALTAVEQFLKAVTPPPPPPPTTWQMGNFGSRLGMYNGDANGNSVGAAAQVGILDGFTPPLYTSYPWGCTGTINQSPNNNGITAIAQDASSRGLKLMIGFPVSGGVDNCTVKYSTVLSGGRDADAKYFVQTLVANGCADAMIRMGWEMNQANNVNGNAAQYAQAVQHLVTVMRSVPGQKIQIVWNPTMDSGETQADIESYYPGDFLADGKTPCVDGVCLDFYDCYFYTNAGGPGVPGSAYPGISITWPYYLTFPASGGGAGAGLNWLANFGTTHGKWIGFCECGNGYSDQWRIGGVDNAPFWTDLAQWTMAHSKLVKVIGLWDAFNQGWQNGANPKSREALVAALNLTPTG